MKTQLKLWGVYGGLFKQKNPISGAVLLLVLEKAAFQGHFYYLLLLQVMGGGMNFVSVR
jgi:hypothetical protein